MRRIALITCLAALALPAAARADAPAPPVLAAQLTTCTTGADVALRAATFTGTMPTIDGASVLAMRFVLERRKGSTFKPFKASTFGRWERSAPGAAGFVYEKDVERLSAPASYRAAVQFRWYDAAGNVLREVRRRTPLCREPELRPDLAPAGIAPGAQRADGSVPYAVGLRNTGVGDALAFSVRLSVGGVALTPLIVPGLASAASTVVTFVGPACEAGDTLRAVVDPGADVEESDEADNALVQRCVAG